MVSTLSAFNSAAAGSNKAVIYVTGNLAQGAMAVGSNKTIIGCAGKNATLNGTVQIKGSKNVIIRNMNIVGYNCMPPDVDVTKGGQCQNGQDAMTIDASTNVWLDHNAISDGSDGNLDIVHGSDFVTVSYTKLFYSTKRQDPNDTGAAGHRFSDLVGGSDTNGAQDTGHLNVTWHHDWWGQYVVERMARVRFGKNHFFNDLWTSSGDSYCIGVGVSSNILSEHNAFVGVATPIDTTSYSNAASVAKSSNNLYMGTSGSTADKNPGSVFTPPYAYTAEAASAVQADVQANAGPK
jgi:pectate lyase